MPETDQPTTINVDCTHPQVTHFHGTLNCYISDRCRCDDCTQANYRYGKQYRRARNGESFTHLGDYWKPGSPEWLAVMRRGLLTAVVESFERDGESRFL